MLKIATAIMAGFIGMAVMAGMADFGWQSYKAGKHPLEFGLDGWVASVAERGARRGETRRFADGSGGSAEPVRDLRSLLPAAPAGWQRQAWSSAQAKLIKSLQKSPPPSQAEMQAIAEKESAPRNPFSTTVSLMGTGFDRKLQRESWVYVRGRERISIRLKRMEPPREPGSIAEVAAARMANASSWETSEMFFARIGGVVYEEETNDFKSSVYRSLRGFVGPRDGEHIKILVMAQARDTTIRTLLKKIDHNRLRAEITPRIRQPVSAAAEDELRAERAAKLARERELRSETVGNAAQIERKLNGYTATESGGSRCIYHRGQRICEFTN